MQNQDHAPKHYSRSLLKRLLSRFPERGSHGSFLADIALVAFWGASIPGLMWLGAWSGF